MKSLKDPIILDFKKFKIDIDRNSAHDRDIVYEYLHNLMLDPLLSEIIENRLHEGDIFLDIGANNGFFSLLASTLVGPKGKVYAFEPSIKSYLKLQKNIQLNHSNNIFAFNVALGEKSGVSDFYEFGAFDGSNSAVKMPGGIKTSVQFRPLDDFDSIQKPDFVKIDVEGYEKEVLLGAKHTILENDNVILIAEYNRSILKKKGEDYSAVINLLISYGFEIHEMDDANRKISEKIVKSYKDLNPWGCNIYAFKP